MQSRPFFRWMVENFQGKEKIAKIIVETLRRLARP
jgi:hypothetical protein